MKGYIIGGCMDSKGKEAKKLKENEQITMF